MIRPSTTVLSYDKTVSFSIGRDANVYAVYEDDLDTAQISMKTSVYDKGDQYVRLDLAWRTPEGSKVESAGFASTTNYGMGYVTYSFMERGKPKTTNIFDELEDYYYTSKHGTTLSDKRQKYPPEELAMRMLYGYSIDSAVPASVLSMPAKNPGASGAYAALTPLNDVAGQGPYLYVMGYVKYKDAEGKSHRLLAGPVALTRTSQVKLITSVTPVDDF